MFRFACLRSKTALVSSTLGRLRVFTERRALSHVVHPVRTVTPASCILHHFRACNRNSSRGAHA